MDELCALFKSIDAHFDTLTIMIIRLRQQIDRHAIRLDGADQGIFEMEEHTTAVIKLRETVGWLLKATVVTNEDREMRSLHNNLWIMEAAKSTNNGRPDIFVKCLLTVIFSRQDFSYKFVVERAHRSLGPHPPPGAPSPKY
ncbi:hypothetical protein NDU88_005399 [Pleurodeles waltl]|uniref:Uncharacterized protein n=1 Tax=Pleurodeles waltl TaxID=8319 RepID=A0AAV7WXS6_PLEWA|nr:hypothetical protein NDU88_005399 [Pleurodeles waltl]